jgi:hypothetical protein
MADSRSILHSTKKVLGLDADYTPFDQDITTHINATFSLLAQLGVGPVGGFTIESNENLWTELNLPAIQLNLVKAYVFLRVRMLFDPPTTSYLLTSMENQIKEFEWRLNVLREEAV